MSQNVRKKLSFQAA